MHPLLTDELLRRLVEVLLANLHREYPCSVRYHLSDASELKTAKERTPSFFGCFDWHSAVHSHFALVRLLRFNTPLHAKIVANLSKSFEPAHLEGELQHLTANPTFEMPYGLAWLLALYSEIDRSSEPAAAQWRVSMEDLARHACMRLESWFAQLPAPIRSGEHNQSAFAMSLSLLAARSLSWKSLEATIIERAGFFYEQDRGAPMHYEPSAHDFLSPSLAEAELMMLVLPAELRPDWLSNFLETPRYEPMVAASRSDGKLVHWDGLNLSRAWMSARIASTLPASHSLRPLLQERAEDHLLAGLRSLEHMEYAGSHWLCTFALYALTEVST